MAAGGGLSGIDLEKGDRDKTSPATVSVERLHRWNDRIVGATVMVGKVSTWSDHLTLVGATVLV